MIATNAATKAATKRETETMAKASAIKSAAMRTMLLAPLAVAAGLVILGAASDRSTAEGLRVAPVSDPIVAKECGACHMPYPPALLPAQSWKAIVSGLKDHFGENAELDAKTTKHIADYLEANAADARGGLSGILRGVPKDRTPTRITDFPWWQRIHGRFSAATLKRHGIKSAANCAGCHRAAPRGYFEE
jgi:mono/diheme cytochrome c family protein